MSEPSISLDEALARKRQEEKRTTYDRDLGFKPEEFDEIVELLKAIAEKIETMKAEGFTQDEINAQMIYELVEDDLKKKRTSKRKSRAEAVIRQTITELQQKGIDTSRLEAQWHKPSAMHKTQKEQLQETKDTKYLSSYQSCIKTWFDLKKRIPNFEVKEREELSRESQQLPETITDFQLAVAFCKKHHKDIDKFMQQVGIML